MAKIIIFGDIDMFPVYIKVDGGKEMTVGDKKPRYIEVSPGEHLIEATTANKLERATSSFGDASSLGGALLNASNSTIGGTIDFDVNDVLLIQLELKGAKTKLYNEMVSESEAGEYVDMSELLSIDEKGVGKEKSKWVALFLCLVLGVLGAHKFYEGKTGMGILYLLTGGLVGIGILVDLFIIIGKPNPYYV